MQAESVAPKTAQFVRVGSCLYRYSSNKVYYAVLKHGGKIIRQSLKTSDRKQADRDLARLKKSLEKVDLSAGKLTLAELADRYLASIEMLDDKSKRTRASIAKVLKETWPQGKEQAIGTVNTSEIQTWLGTHAERLSKATLNEYLRLLRKMFELAVADRLVAENPAASIKQRKLDKPLRETPTWEQFQAIVADIRKQKYNADADDSADFVESLGLLGLGNAEAAYLQVKHLDFIHLRMTLHRKKTGKGYMVPIFPQAEAFLKRRIEKKKLAAEDYVFNIKDAKKALAAACKRLKFPHFSHRAFRRCFITRAIELGVDFKTLAGWQGHSDGGALIAKTYSHLRNEHSDLMAKKMIAPARAEILGLPTK